jgi:hypothetical protein
MGSVEIGDFGSLGQTHTPDKASIETARMRGATGRLMQVTPGWRSIIGISVTAAIVWVVPLAAADEGITLLNGDTAAVKGTTIACTVQTDSLGCRSRSGLTASLSDSGKVQLTKGARRLFPRSVSSARAKHLRIGVSQGFFVGAGLILCHVYVATATTLSCYKSDAKGGIAGTYGFDMTDKAVVVFRFGKIQDRHDLQTFS